MKRRLSQDFDDDEAEPMFVGSPAHKQPRVGATALPWDADASVADLEALCARVSDGSAGATDLREMLRLALGGAVGGADSAWRAAERPDATTSCEPVVGVHRDLWRTLARPEHTTALNVVRESASAWPPTFADVVRAYAGLDPEDDSALGHLYLLQKRVEDRSLPEVVDALVQGIDAAARRRAILDAAGSSPSQSFVDPFAGTDWVNALVQGCNPNVSYFILESDGDEDTRVALFAIDSQSDAATLVATAAVPYCLPTTRARPFDVLSRVDAGPLASIAARPRVTDALAPYAGSLTLFLAALASPEPCQLYEDEEETYADDIGRTSLLLDPTPAGAQQIKATMVPLPSEFALPDPVRDLIDDNYANAEDDWYSAPMRGAWMDECRLVIALRLFEGQVRARAESRHYAPQNLVDFAARAYTGPLRAGMAPDEVLDRAADYAWQGVCAAPTLPSGHLAGADRLLDVARLWGVEVDATEIARPEFLCGRLAQAAAERRSGMPLSLS
nr:hypothetical protein [Pandoravirus belohorizontensis]